MMGALMVSLGVFHLMLFLSGSNSRQVSGGKESPVDCNTEGKECAYDSTNLIAMINQVPSIAECRQLCLERDKCEFITYLDEGAAPLAHACLLFKTCETVEDCDADHCASQNMDCYRTCGSNVVGHLDENVIDSVPNTQTEFNCKNQCSNRENCSWYTYYHQNNTLFHQFCFLQTELLKPIRSCEGQCVSGPPDCAVSHCLLEMNGETFKSLKLTDTGRSHSITVTGLRSGESCTLRFLAVGGGGQGYYAGGGSGYVQYRSLQVGQGTTITAEVGSRRQPSTVLTNGEKTVAYRGEDSHNGSASASVGGAGYSGGGVVGYAGGADGGGGGGGGRGGAGSGENLSALSLSSWTLSPGAGGGVYPGICGGGCGGGGGGVLVDGAGPGTSEHSGQGYGGGDSSGFGGSQGVVIVEVA